MQQQKELYLPYHRPSAPSLLLDEEDSEEGHFCSQTEASQKELSLIPYEHTPLCKQSAGKPENKQTQEQYVKQCLNNLKHH